MLYCKININIKIIFEHNNICADVKTPLVILVVGGDRFTLEKVADATSKSVQIPVVIVNGSGKIADMLAAVYMALEHKVPR